MKPLLVFSMVVLIYWLAEITFVYVAMKELLGG